ncbi:polysaccharide deacetylase family protein [Intestinibacillus massiliensis]|uniref:polysaccharide deacetylase family protein n=1 Tax=Intestinibacillus massiliensis TaxID=1871029 RepID=UPI000B34F713|nr:polysaccharide deacetylase family protein [Intestinibacillus massiliensis]
MKYIKRALCIALVTALLLCAAQVSAAQSITLTAVNDQFLPLSDSTMPARKSGEMYVPYSVFTGTLGISASYNASQKTLVLSGQSNTLTFYISEGYVYDQNMTSYAQPAYFINGGVYVPVKLICSRFGLSYSVISSDYPVLRIINDNATLSDHALIAGSAETIRKMVAAYQAPSGEGGATPSTPDIPVAPPAVEERIPQPSVVYLTFTGAPTEQTPAILDTLQEFGRTATFFLAAEDPLSRGDDVRRIVSEGHALGLAVTADAHNADPETLVQSLDAQNGRLLLLCGVTTRLVMVENGSATLSQAQRDALADGGYRLWDATLDSRDDSRTAFRAARTVLTAFQKSSDPAVVRLRHGAQADGTLTYILRYMQQTSIQHSTIQLSDTPINAVGDTR